MADQNISALVAQTTLGAGHFVVGYGPDGVGKRYDANLFANKDLLEALANPGTVDATRQWLPAPHGRLQAIEQRFNPGSTKASRPVFSSYETFKALIQAGAVAATIIASYMDVACARFYEAGPTVDHLVFRYSGSDPGAADPTAFAIPSGAAGGGYMVQQYQAGLVHANQLGFKYDNTDERNLLHNALASALIAGLELDPTKTIAIGSKLTLPSNKALVSPRRGATIKALTHMTDALASRRHMINCGSNTWVENLTLDGGQFNAGGLGYVGVTGGVNINCRLTNMVNRVYSGSWLSTVGMWGISIEGASDIMCINPVGDHLLHGIQVWLGTRIAILNPTMDQIDGGGVWFASSYNCRVIGGVITNCGDICGDIEGGFDTQFIGTTFKSGNNGEMGIFVNAVGGHENELLESCCYVDCHATRTATYLRGDGVATACESANGSLFVASISIGSRNVGCFGCKITLEAGMVFSYHPGTSIDANPLNDPHVYIHNCEIRFKHGGALFKIHSRVQGLHITENHWIFEAAVTGRGEWKNAARSILGKNTFEFLAAPTVAPIYVLTTDAIPAAQASLIWKNEWCGIAANEFTIEFVMQSWGQAIMAENTLGQKPLKWGGLQMTEYSVPIFRDQKLKVAISRTGGATHSIMKAGNGDIAVVAGTSETLDLNSTSHFSNIFRHSNGFVNPTARGRIFMMAGPAAEHNNVYDISILATSASNSAFFRVDEVPDLSTVTAAVVAHATPADFAAVKAALDVLGTRINDIRTKTAVGSASGKRKSTTLFIASAATQMVITKPDGVAFFALLDLELNSQLIAT